MHGATSSRARLSSWLLLVTCCVACLACVHRRDVTPWLRTSSYEPFELVAESGRQARGGWIRVERRVNGAWVDLPETSDRAFAFADGTRVVVEGKLLTEDGATIDVDCRSDLRADPSRTELLCIEIERDNDEATVGPQITIARFDEDGRLFERRTVRSPLQLPRENAFSPMVEPHFLGFLPEGLVFSVFVAHENDSFASDVIHQCTAYVLSPVGKWRELGTLTFDMGALWKCNFPRPWNEDNDWHIEPGGFLQDSKGEPNP